MSQEQLTKAEKFYSERILGWMIADLKKSVEAGTNYLTALGCLVYTEVIGIFLPAFPKEQGKSEARRFYRCLFRLQSAEVLRNVDDLLKKETSKNIYEQLRNNAAHIYFPLIKIKKNNKPTLFVPLIITRDSYIKDLATGKKARSAPIYWAPNRELVIASKNYTLELETLVRESYQLTFVKKDPKYQKAAIAGINLVMRDIISHS